MALPAARRPRGIAAEAARKRRRWSIGMYPTISRTIRRGRDMMRHTMKRRRFMQALAVAPTAPALVAQQPAANADDNPKLELSVPDAAAETVLHFFNTQQFAALQKLSEILMPPAHGAPGALNAHAPEFLDFLIGDSPAERQQLYRSGLDGLNLQARKRYNRAFSELDAAQAGPLLAPLREAWTYDPPA